MLKSIQFKFVILHLTPKKKDVFKKYFQNSNLNSVKIQNANFTLNFKT